MHNPRRALTKTIGLLLAVALGVGAVAAPAAAGDNKKLATEPGEVVVKIEPWADIDTVTERYGATVTNSVLASRGIYLLSVPIDRSEKLKEQVKATEKFAKEMTKDADKQKKEKKKNKDKSQTVSDIVYAEPNFVTDVAEGDRLHAWPDDDRLHAWPGQHEGEPISEQAYSVDQPALAHLDLGQAHAMAQGTGAIVAVLDTGIALDHPALAGKVIGGYDYVDDDAYPDDIGNGYDDDDNGEEDEGVGHGTHISGIVSLVAPEASIWVGRVLDSDGHGNVFIVAEAIHEAIAVGADVINLSFGVDKKVESKVLADALKAAKDANVVVVAAAGNRGSGREHYPAADKDVLGVGALELDTGRLADFSNHGKWVAIAAPGEFVVSTVPEGYAVWSGTSMATPVVAGQAALLVSTKPGVKPDKVRKAIFESADKIERGPKVEKGRVDIAASLEKKL